MSVFGPAATIRADDRRRFVQRLTGYVTALVGLSGATLSARRANASLREAVPTGIVPAHPSLAAFPSLAYTPPGFHWVNTYVRPLDGFGGIDEVALWFKRSRGAYAHNHPLSVYMTTAPRYPLVGTGGREGTLLPLIVAGAVVTATYFDG
jgi:hypothetical protein